MFPILGTAVMSLGLYLHSRMTETTPSLTVSLYLLVMGLGIGMVMQVLVIAVQHAVDYRVLGTATSGVTFFRSIGGVFGVAVFGSLCPVELTPAGQQTFERLVAARREGLTQLLQG